MNLAAFAQWPWPLPAVLVWVVAWSGFVAMRLLQVPMGLAWWLAAALGVVGSVFVHTWVRRSVLVLGFPLSWWLVTGAGGVQVMLGWPAWVWLMPLALLALLYPPGSWRDAPLFPTPTHALDGLADQVHLPLAGKVLDAGCGLGDGLLALERAWPEVQVHGVERSWPLRLACGWRCRTAHVRQGDMWREDWSPYELVYLFQRPESMSRAWEKAHREMRPGTWLVSLEFAVPDRPPTLQHACPDGRTLWLYQKAEEAAHPPSSRPEVDRHGDGTSAEGVAGSR